MTHLLQAILIVLAAVATGYVFGYNRGYDTACRAADKVLKGVMDHFGVESEEGAPDA